MAFCTQCGAQLPENGKFCPNCGAAYDPPVPVEITADKSVDDLVPAPVLPVPVQQPIADTGTEPAKANVKPRRTLGTLLALAAFVLAVLALFSDSLALSIVFSAAAIVTGVFALIKRGRLKAFTILAFLIAAFAMVDTVWYIATGEIMVAPPKTEVDYDQTEKVTEGGITFEIPGGYEEKNNNGVSMYSYGKNILVMFASEKIQVPLDTVTSAKMSEALDTLSQNLLSDRKALGRTDKKIASYDSRVAEYTGTFEGTQCYMKISGIKNTDNSSFVRCAVVCMEDVQTQGEELFDSVISTAAPSGGTNKNSIQTNAAAAPGSSKTGSSAGVDPELKEFLDSYESFVDKYVEFMQKYMEDPSNVISMLSDYLKMAEELEDFSEQADRYDPDDMSAADAAYYLEVMTRCETKLLKALA